MLKFKKFQVNYRGQSHPVNNMNLAEILPDTEHYMTYEGSTTYPGCWETVTWIVMNKPIYISRQAGIYINQLKSFKNRIALLLYNHSTH